MTDIEPSPICPTCGAAVPKGWQGGCPRCLANRLLGEPSEFLGEEDLHETVLTNSAFSRKVAKQAPEQIGPFRILEELGEGGFGVVYRAEQTRPVRRQVALKVIKPGMASTEIVQRFEAERQALALMDHPHIAKVFDAGTTTDGRPYFVMELVQGQPLTRYCDERHLGIRERLGLFINVCAAVQHAHQKAVLHRDLKPSNILVAEVDGLAAPKVIDFGIAKALEQRLTEQTLYTAQGLLVGTPQYMSPEQVNGTGDVDTRSDIYSLGVVLYELLTGSPPVEAKRFKNAAVDEFCRIIREEEAVKPSSRIAQMDEVGYAEVAKRHGVETTRRWTREVRGDLDWIVLRALEKDRERRYDSATSFAADLNRYLDNEPVLAMPPSAAYRLYRLGRKHWKAVAILALIFMALTGGLVMSSLALAREKQAVEREKRAVEQETVQRTEAEKQRNAAKDALVESNRQLERSQLEEGRAWLERAKAAKGEGDHLKALMLAGRAVGFEGYGRKAIETPEFEQKFPFLLGRPMQDETAERERRTELAEVRQFVASVSPTLLPIWSSPITAHHHGPVTSVAFSPDGSRLASGSQDQTVKLWDAATGKEIAALEGHSGTVTGVAFSPDGARLVSGSDDKTVKVWDATTGKEIVSFQGHSQSVTSVAFSPDGRRLASGAGSFNKPGELKLWEAATGKEIVSFQGHSQPVTSVAFSPDGRRLASGAGSFDNPVELKLWDAATGKEILPLEGHSSSVTSVAFSPDGARLASGSEDKTVKLWDVSTGKEIATLRGHRDTVESVAFSPDGTRLASGAGSYGEPGELKLWDAASGQEIATIRRFFGGGKSVAFSPDGSRLASGSSDNAVKLWDAASGREISPSQGHSAGVTCVAFSPDGARLASGSGDRTVKLWDMATGQEIAPLLGHSRAVTSVAFSTDGTRLASGSLNKAIKLWDVASAKEIATLHGHLEGVTSVTFSPDGSRLASGTGGYKPAELKLWDLVNSKEITTVRGHESAVTSVAFSPDGTRIASGSGIYSELGELKLWNAASGQEIVTLKGHSRTVTSVAFSPDGTRLASGSEDETVKLWDMATGREIAPLKGHSHSVTSVAFSPDGRWLASGSRDKTVKLWDAATGREIATLQGHSETVTSVAFSPDGNRIASGSEDRTVKLWDAAHSAIPSPVTREYAILYSVAFSPDGTQLASGYADGTIKLWDLLSRKELATLLGHREEAANVASETGAGTARFVTALAFSPDGTRLASAAEANYQANVKLWDTASGKELATLNGMRGSEIIAPGKFTQMTFSPDGTRLAVESLTSGIQLWDTVSGKELMEKPDFCSFDWSNSGVLASHEGKIEAVADRNAIRLLPTNAALDLLSLERRGYLTLVGRNITWTRNDSLLTSKHFTPIHWREDVLAQLAVTENATEAMVLRLRFCGQGGQWRALATVWEQAKNAGLTSDAKVRLEFCVQAAMALRGLAWKTIPEVPADLWKELLEFYQTGDWQETRFSLPMVQALPAVLAVTEVPELIKAINTKVFAEASLPWLEAIADGVAKRRKQKETPESAQTTLVTFVRTCAASRPESLPLLRLARDTYSASDPAWLALVNQLLSRSEATVNDYIESAYAAWQIPAMATSAKDLLARLETRFSGNEKADLRVGWCYIQINDAPAALRIFRAAVATMKPQEKPDTELLAGLSLALWLNQRQAEAIATYKQLIIEHNRRLLQYEDLAKPETFMRRALPQAAILSLKSLRTETLKLHPELEGKGVPGK